MNNILGRVTGGNPSAIFGTIDSATYYPSANLFLMNPAGFLFGPNATVNVGGMMHVTSADYLKLADGNLFNAIPNVAADAMLTTFPVAAFGFLGSNPAAIAVQGSQLTVANGTGLSLVGGNRGFTYTDPDTGATPSVPGGVTMTGGKLSAPGGQIGIASLASPGEILHQTMVAGPNINGETFTDRGPISMSGGATLNVSGNGGGTIRILSGQFIMDNAFLVANTTVSSDGMPVAISLDVTGDIALTNRSAIVAQTLNTVRGGNVELTSANLSLGEGSRIGTQTSGTGQAGDITITVSDIVSLVGIDNSGNPSRIESATVASGSAGSIDLVASTVTLDNQAVIRTQAFSDGPAGDITLRVGNLLANNGGRIENTGSESAPSGNIRVTATDTITLSGRIDESNTSGIENRNEGFGGTGTIALDTNNLVMSDGARVLNSTFFSLPAPGDPQLSVQAHNSINMTTGSEIRVFNFSGDAGALNLSAQTISLSDTARIATVTSADGNAGPITITGDSLTLSNGGQITSASQAGIGRGGDITINVTDKVLLTGQGVDEFGTTIRSGVFSSTHSDFPDPSIVGDAGQISISSIKGIIEVTNGARIDSSSTGFSGGNAGSIILTTPAMVVDGGAISTSTEFTGNAGNIQINAGNQFTMTNSSVTTEADAASGGAIKISTTPSGTVQLTDSTISASVLDGAGGGGSVNIDPQFVILQNSHILATATHGPGGNISITTNLLLPDAYSTISASSQFGVNGTVTIQSPNAPGSGQVQPLGKTPLLPTSLLNQHCASLAGGEFSSFTVAGRDSLPTEPGSWLTSPLVASGGGEGIGVRGERHVARGEGLEGETPSLSLRQIAPAGFLTQSFAADWSASCQS